MCLRELKFVGRIPAHSFKFFIGPIVTVINIHTATHFAFAAASFYNASLSGLTQARKSKVGLAAAKTAAMRINLNIDGLLPRPRSLVLP